MALVIDDAQSAFLLGRLITYIAIITFEIFHNINGNTSKVSSHMALTLDMSKSFDWVEQCFLEILMQKMHFPCHFIKLLMSCIMAVSYSVLLNGIPTQTFTPLRGIWQDDPLSPNLFSSWLLCVIRRRLGIQGFGLEEVLLFHITFYR